MEIKPDEPNYGGDMFTKADLKRFDKERYGKSAVGIAGNTRQIRQEAAFESPSSNAPCPCGSNKKYKKCCMFKGVGEPPPIRNAVPLGKML